MNISKLIRDNQVQDDLIKPLAIKVLISSYALMVVQEQKEFKSEQWYKHSLQIAKGFKKRKPDRVSKESNKRLQAIYDEAKNFDADFFIDKLFSPYIPMILLLDYMIYEMRDIEMRSKYLHLNTTKIIEEMEKTEWLRDVGIDTHKYVSGLIDIIDKGNQ